MPNPPYYAVIFTSFRSSSDPAEYECVAERMAELAAQQPGYLGMTSLRDADGQGVTICYWTDLQSIANWRDNPERRIAQQKAKQTLYDDYRVEVCLIETQSAFTRHLMC